MSTDSIRRAIDRHGSRRQRTGNPGDSIDRAHGERLDLWAAEPATRDQRSRRRRGPPIGTVGLAGGLVFMQSNAQRGDVDTGAALPVVGLRAPMELLGTDARPGVEPEPAPPDML